MRRQRGRRLCLPQGMRATEFGWLFLVVLRVPVPQLWLLLAAAVVTTGVLQASCGALAALNPDQRIASKLLRPRPEERYHLPQPVDAPLPYRRPDINEETLRRILGADFQPKYMSITKPTMRYRDPHQQLRSRNGTRRHRLHKLRRGGTSNRESLKTLLNGSLADVPKDQPNFRRTLRKFLQKHTECRITRHWHDLGERYFPRYVHEGSCQQTHASCSIPPGMTCRPHKQKELKLLWWHCTTGAYLHRTQVNQTHFNAEKQACTWIRMVYTVLSECRCRCKNDDES